eukprot:3900270-Pyramimonas_sp.AAC.1
MFDSVRPKRSLSGIPEESEETRAIEFLFEALKYEVLACLGFRRRKIAQEASLGRLAALLERFKAVLRPSW